MNPTVAFPQNERVVSLPTATVQYLAAEASEFVTHTHNAFTVTSLLAGELQLMVGETVSTLRPGQSGLTNASQPHAALGRNFALVSVRFAAEPLCELVMQTGLSRASVELSFKEPVVTDQVISSLASSIAEELCGVRPGRVPMVDALVRQLAIHLVRNHMVVRRADRVEWSRVGPVDRRLRLAVEYVHDHYAESLTLEEIAGAAFLSEYHFARLFKQLMGVTPHSYLTSVRLEHARRQLAETETPISEIAAGTGFGSQSHLTRVFKSVTGTTPGVYRRAARQSVDV